MFFIRSVARHSVGYIYKASPLCIVLIFIFPALFSVDAHAGSFWRRVDQARVAAKQPLASAAHYMVYTADEPSLRSFLFSLPVGASDARLVELPMPDGSMKTFNVRRSSTIPPQLAAKYPGLATFNAWAVGDPNVTAKLDYTVYGFHAMIFDGGEVSFIDPYDNSGSGSYTVHYKRDEIANTTQPVVCEVGKIGKAPEQVVNLPRRSALRTSNGYELRTYRLALACDHFYADSATGITDPSVAQVLSKMVTSLNRINGVYERELSVTLTLVPNDDTLIFVTDTRDPYSSDNGNAGALCIDNQTVCDERIGDAGYDIGHVFTTGAGGLSQVGVVCQSHMKAESATGRNNPVGDGFDIDFVAHEIGHEFGANHPFNNGTDRSCGGQNRYQPSSYEPGSGSTIMAYAGICAPDDLQPHSDAYFHSVSLLEIQDYISTIGNSCAVKMATGNKLVALPSFTHSYSIPYLTPFELIAPAATDSVADTSVTYCWEEWDVGDTDLEDKGQRLVDTRDIGPIFRSYSPVKSPIRVFPKNSMVLNGVLSNVGNEDNEGEKVPDVTRSLTFRLTVRDIYQGYGCFLIPDDSVFLEVVNTGAGFAVTSQADSGDIFIGNSMQQITWNVVSTNSFPVNTPNVDIYMSADGGNSWTYNFGTFPNTGSATITLPDPDTTIAAARIKVKGHDNIFFNVNRYNFSVAHSDGKDTGVAIFPVPAHNSVRVSTGYKGLTNVVMYNSIGQQVWIGKIDGEKDIPLSTWGRGIYIMKAIDLKGNQTIRKFIVD